MRLIESPCLRQKLSDVSPCFREVFRRWVFRIEANGFPNHRDRFRMIAASSYDVAKAMQCIRSCAVIDAFELRQVFVPRLRFIEASARNRNLAEEVPDLGIG